MARPVRNRPHARAPSVSRFVCGSSRATYPCHRASSHLAGSDARTLGSAWCCARSRWRRIGRPRVVDTFECALREPNVLRLGPATAAAYDAIYRLMSETWERTYAGYFTEHNIQEARRQWLDALPLKSALDDPSMFIELAWDDSDRLMGFIAARLLSSDALYILRLYVHPAHHRLGVGSALMRAAVAAFPRVATIRLDVEEGNGRGRAFWTQQGFHLTGCKHVPVAGVMITLIEMEKHLG